MPTLNLDTETFSTAPIEAGHSRYWEEARVLCVAWSLDGGPVRVTVAPAPHADGMPTPWACPPALGSALVDAGIVVEGWNIAFDHRALEWLHRVHGWPSVPFSRTRCTMARASVGALPQALGTCAPIIQAGLAKDGEGAALMMRMCKPPANCPAPVWQAAVRALGIAGKGSKTPEALARKAAAKEAAIARWQATASHLPAAPHTPENLARLAAYCCQDVVAEQTIARAPRLPPMPAGEEVLRCLDSNINRRGVAVDVALLTAARELLAPVRAEGEAELAALTGGAVESANQTQAIRNWCALHGLELPNLQSETLDELRAADDVAQAEPDPATPPLMPQVRRVLDLRASLGLASLAKLESAAEYLCKDGRLRDMLRYYRASTGRWAGAGFQPQNLPRPAFGRKAAAWAIDRVKARDVDNLRLVYGDDLPATLCSLLRGLLVAAPGKVLMGADYSQIEARVLAWAAGQEDLVQLFARKGKVYETMAATVYGMRVEDVTKDGVERQVGKFTVLGAGYQMGAGAFQRQLKKQTGILLPLARCKEIVAAYRARNQDIVAWWHALNDAAVAAVRTPGTVTQARGAAFHCETDRRWLRMRLPSGRCLYYQTPELEWDAKFECWGVTYWGVDRYTHKWGKQRGYGGFWAENFVQATARDLMAKGMLNAEAAGFPLVLTIHDELLAEVDEARAGDVATFEKCLTDAPAWAAGIPLACEGWAATRYHK